MVKITANVILLLAIVFAIGTVQAESDLEQVTLQLKWQHQFQFAGYYAAVEQGFYAEEGLAVTIRELKPHDNVLYQTLSGRADYSVGGAGILAYYARGAPIKALAAIFQHDALVFISKRESGIISPYEMKGKRLMFDNKAGDNAPLTALLADVGISSNDYTHVELQFGIDALLNDKTDVMSAYITNQPYHFAALGQKINIINPQNYGFDFYGDILYTSEAEINNNPGRAERFRRASLKGWQYALEHPEQIIQLIKNKYKAEDSIAALRYEAKEMRKLILPESITLGTIETKRLRRLADIYAGLGLAEPLTDEKLAKFVFDSAADIQLTAEEQAWLNQHQTIRLGIDRDFAPYEWVDDDGNYHGLAADYMRLIEQRLGINFEIIKDKPWPEITAMAQKGELDLLSCLSHSPEREDYLFFSQAYIKNPVVIVNPNRSGYIGSLQNLTGKTVAIERGYVTHENLARNHPDINLLVVGTTQGALEKVAVGEADAYVGDANYANYAIKQADLLNLQFAGQTEYDNAYRIGVTKSNPELVSIINKVLANISDQEHEAIKSQWLGLRVTKGIDKETIIQAIALLGLIVLVTTYWIYRLRESKEAIRQSEARLRSIIEASPIPHALNDNDNNIVYLNQAFNNTFGYQLADIPTLDEWWSKAYPDPEYRKWVSTTWQKRRETEEPLEVEVCCKNGDVKYVVVNAAMISETATNLYVVNLFDITDRKRAEEKLYLSGRVFDEAHEGIMITDANEIIIDVNPAFKEITGYEPEDVIGKHSSLLRSDKYKPEFYQAIKEELDKQGFWQGEIWSQKRNGTLYAELLTVSTLLVIQEIWPII